MKVNMVIYVKLSFVTDECTQRGDGEVVCHSISSEFLREVQFDTEEKGERAER